MIILEPTGAVGWTLQDPTNAATIRSIEMLPANGSFNISRREEQSAMGPIGRPNLVVVADVVRGYHFEFHFEFLSMDDYDVYEALRVTQRVLLLRSFWLQRQWYIRFNETEELSIYNTEPARMEVHIGAEEQDSPD